VRLVPTVLSCLFIIIIIIIIMKSKAVKNAARYRDYMWVGPDRSVESSFVFILLLLLWKVNGKDPTPVMTI
jgi:hypothetical protein